VRLRSRNVSSGLHDRCVYPVLHLMHNALCMVASGVI
jgi:hypothetical protein